MDIPGLLIACAIGGVAGFLAGQILKGRGFGLVGNIVVGLLGSFLFGLLFGNFRFFGESILNSIAGGTIGAILLLLLISFVRKNT